jgi:gamma-glutamylcysteine synthetase
MFMEKKDILHLFKKQLYAELKDKIKAKQTTFGFEVEYLPSCTIGLDHMEKLYQFLPELGFFYNGYDFVSDSGLFVSFEPGGQIEYCSPPLLGSDMVLFRQILQRIETTNEKIFSRLNIKYLATGYIPGRTDAPMCLQTKRYLTLHDRLSRTGTRGREMMKATASVHLHVGFRSMDEILLIYKLLACMSKHDEFAMSKERRDIWNHTDPVRCSMPLINFKRVNTTEDLLEHLIHYALCAEDLYLNISVYDITDITFDYFKTHMTTMFTDVRLNLKGPTMELRTLDSISFHDMEKKWKLFISVFEQRLNEPPFFCKEDPSN